MYSVCINNRGFSVACVNTLSPHNCARPQENEIDGGLERESKVFASAALRSELGMFGWEVHNSGIGSCKFVGTQPAG